MWAASFHITPFPLLFDSHISCQPQTAWLSATNLGTQNFLFHSQLFYTVHGTQVQPPPYIGITRYELATLDDSYIGLYSYVYDHGYCPTRLTQIIQTEVLRLEVKSLKIELKCWSCFISLLGRAEEGLCITLGI